MMRLITIALPLLRKVGGSLIRLFNFSRYHYSETEDQLPTSVLLQRIRVEGEKEKVGRRKGRMVRRRRRRRRKNHLQEETLEAGKDVAREQRVYFTPL